MTLRNKIYVFNAILWLGIGMMIISCSSRSEGDYESYKINNLALRDIEERKVAMIKELYGEKK